MSEFKIEKGIPLQEARGCKRRYPFKEMAVGDSVFIPGKRAGKFSVHYYAGQRYGMKFSLRAVEGGVRVWRTA